ncbi:MAG: hypothetical protein V1740_05485 [Candidatus Woesearchaeota archaeon]
MVVGNTAKSESTPAILRNFHPEHRAYAVHGRLRRFLHADDIDAVQKDVPEDFLPKDTPYAQTRNLPQGVVVHSHSQKPLFDVEGFEAGIAEYRRQINYEREYGHFLIDFKSALIENLRKIASDQKEEEVQLSMLPEEKVAARASHLRKKAHYHRTNGNDGYWSNPRPGYKWHRKRVRGHLGNGFVHASERKLPTDSASYDGINALVADGEDGDYEGSQSTYSGQNYKSILDDANKRLSNGSLNPCLSRHSLGVYTNPRKAFQVVRKLSEILGITLPDPIFESLEDHPELTGNHRNSPELEDHYGNHWACRRLDNAQPVPDFIEIPSLPHQTFSDTFSISTGYAIDPNSGLIERRDSA